MTWSIIAKDPATGAFGLAVSTCAFAVGARVPYGMGGVGAVATQSFVNPFAGIDGLRLLQEGRSAKEVIAIVTAADPGASNRQIHVMDANGRTAAFTGMDCVDWCGSVKAKNVSVAGNMLVGPQVVSETLKAYEAGGALDFDDRLITALEAGEAAGGENAAGSPPRSASGRRRSTPHRHPRRRQQGSAEGAGGGSGGLPISGTCRSRRPAPRVSTPAAFSTARNSTGAVPATPRTGTSAIQAPGECDPLPIVT